jgi:hypothetical protein
MESAPPPLLIYGNFFFFFLLLFFFFFFRFVHGCFTVLSSTLDVYQGPRYDKVTSGFHFENPSLFSVAEDGSVLFVTSEDDRRAATFDAVTGKELCVWKVNILLLVKLFFKQKKKKKKKKKKRSINPLSKLSLVLLVHTSLLGTILLATVLVNRNQRRKIGTIWLFGIPRLVKLCGGLR